MVASPPGLMSGRTSVKGRLRACSAATPVAAAIQASQVRIDQTIVGGEHCRAGSRSVDMPWSSPPGRSLLVRCGRPFRPFVACGLIDERGERLRTPAQVVGAARVCFTPAAFRSVIWRISPTDTMSADAVDECSTLALRDHLDLLRRVRRVGGHRPHRSRLVGGGTGDLLRLAAHPVGSGVDLAHGGRLVAHGPDRGGNHAMQVRGRPRDLLPRRSPARPAHATCSPRRGASIRRPWRSRPPFLPAAASPSGPAPPAPWCSAPLSGCPAPPSTARPWPSSLRARSSEPGYSLGPVWSPTWPVLRSPTATSRACSAVAVIAETTCLAASRCSSLARAIWLTTLRRLVDALEDLPEAPAPSSACMLL